MRNPNSFTHCTSEFSVKLVSLKVGLEDCSDVFLFLVKLLA